MQQTTQTTISKHAPTYYRKMQYLIAGISLLMGSITNVYADETMTNGKIMKQTMISADNATAGNVHSTQQLLNVNTANALELSSIKGIGFKKAQAIVTYRDTHGHFTNIEQLTLVQGIGEKMLARMQSSITVDEQGQKGTRTAVERPLKPAQEE